MKKGFNPLNRGIFNEAEQKNDFHHRTDVLKKKITGEGARFVLV